MFLLMNLFDFDDYKIYVLARIRAMPQHGRGELLKIAERLKTHSSRISHIFKGPMHLTLEQACELTVYLGLRDLEAQYFLLMVQRERAGTPLLKAATDKQLASVRAQAKELVNRVERDRKLTDQEKATFYSNWYYSGIRLATSISKLQTVDALSEYFDFPRDQVRRVLDFLLASGLCVESEGRLQMNAKATHLESNSPLTARHHANWRIKAMQRHERLSENEMAYTGPMSISLKDQLKIRERLVQLIEETVRVARASEPEESLMCLNIDWIQF